MFSGLFSGESELPRKIVWIYRLRLTTLIGALLSHVIWLAGILTVTPGMMLFAFFALGYAGLTLAFWRCPQCGKYPGNAVRPDYCERCGEAIFGLDTTAEQNTGIEVELRPRRSILMIVLVRFLAGTALLVMFIILAAHGQIPESTFLWIVFGTAAITAWIEWRLWRCPNCRGYLPRGIWPGMTCKKCGSGLWG